VEAWGARGGGRNAYLVLPVNPLVGN